MEESREQFEGEWEKSMEYLSQQPEMQPWKNACWHFWQASRQAVELTFPTQVEYDDPLSAHRAINDCANIIRAAGLRIKGE